MKTIESGNESCEDGPHTDHFLASESSRKAYVINVTGVDGYKNVFKVPIENRARIRTRDTFAENVISVSVPSVNELPANGPTKNASVVNKSVVNKSIRNGAILSVLPWTTHTENEYRENGSKIYVSPWTGWRGNKSLWTELKENRCDDSSTNSGTWRRLSEYEHSVKKYIVNGPRTNVSIANGLRTNESIDNGLRSNESTVNDLRTDEHTVNKFKVNESLGNGFRNDELNVNRRRENESSENKVEENESHVKRGNANKYIDNRHTEKLPKVNKLEVKQINVNGLKAKKIIAKKSNYGKLKNNGFRENESSSSVIGSDATESYVDEGIVNESSTNESRTNELQTNTSRLNDLLAYKSKLNCLLEKGPTHNKIPFNRSKQSESVLANGSNLSDIDAPRSIQNNILASGSTQNNGTTRANESQENVIFINGSRQTDFPENESRLNDLGNAIRPSDLENGSRVNEPLENALQTSSAATPTVPQPRRWRRRANRGSGRPRFDAQGNPDMRGWARRASRTGCGSRTGAIVGLLLALTQAWPSLLTSLEQGGGLRALREAEGLPPAPIPKGGGLAAGAGLRAAHWALAVTRAIELPLLLVALAGALANRRRLVAPWVGWSPLMVIACTAQSILTLVLLLRLISEEKLPLYTLNALRMGIYTAGNILSSVASVVLVERFRRGERSGGAGAGAGPEARREDRRSFELPPLHAPRHADSFA